MMPGPLGCWQTRAQAEDNAALIFAQNLDGVERYRTRMAMTIRSGRHRIGVPSLSRDCTPGGAMLPGVAVIEPAAPRAAGTAHGPRRATEAPAGTGSVATACQISPSTSTWPSRRQRLHGAGGAADERVDAEAGLHAAGAHRQANKKDGDDPEGRADGEGDQGLTAISGMGAATRVSVPKVRQRMPAMASAPWPPNLASSRSRASAATNRSTAV